MSYATRFLVGFLLVIVFGTCSGFVQVHHRQKPQVRTTSPPVAPVAHFAPLQITRLNCLTKSYDSVENDNADNGSENESEDSGVEATVPTLRQLIAFGIPTLSIGLLQPILSIIDTSVVGMTAAATDIAQIAALSPGISWVDSTAYLAQFISILLAAKYAKSLATEDVEKGDRILSHCFIGAILIGVLLGAMQWYLAPAAISAISGTSQHIVPIAVNYARWRALGAPFAVPTLAMQAALLTRKDPVTPLKAALVGGFVNLATDILLVTWLRMGLAGAAIATALSQVACAAYMFWAAYQMLPRKSETKMSKLQLIKSRMSLPTFEEVKSYTAFSAPMLFILASRIGLWSATSIACSNFGALNLAGHQITLNLFCFFASFGDVYGMMSQTYLPTLLFKENAPNPLSNSPVDPNSETAKQDALDIDRFQNFFKVFGRIAFLSVIVNSINSIIGFSLGTFGPKMFTSSVEVGGLMKRVAPFLLLCTVPHGLMAAIEGFLVVARDAAFHTFAYLLTGTCFLSYLGYISKQGGGIVPLWMGFAVYQWGRALIFGARALFLNHKIRKTRNRRSRRHGVGKQQTALNLA